MIRSAASAPWLKAGSRQIKWLAIGLMFVHFVKLSKVVVRFVIGSGMSLYRNGDIVIWSKRCSTRVTLETCRIQKINRQKYLIEFYCDKQSQLIKRSVFKDNIFRLAKDNERAVFLDKVKASGDVLEFK